MKTLRRLEYTFLVTLGVALGLAFPIFPTMAWYLKGSIALAVVLVTGFREWRKDVKPYVDFAEKREFFFDEFCVRAFEALRAYDDTVRLNVMEVDWRLPGKRWGRFRVVYQKGMEGEVDVHLELKADQGVAGEVLRTGHPRVANLEDPDAPSYKLNPRQQRLTEDLTLIFSTPIRALKKAKDGRYYPEDNVIGVINMDSKQKGAFDFYETNAVPGGEATLREEVLVAQANMSRVCSWILG